MWRLQVTCEGLTAEEGAAAPALVFVVFTHRPWHHRVQCTWDGSLSRLVADNDYDATGNALLDEYTDAVVASVACEGTIRLRLASVHVVPGAS